MGTNAACGARDRDAGGLVRCRRLLTEERAPAVGGLDDHVLRVVALRRLVRGRVLLVLEADVQRPVGSNDWNGVLVLVARVRVVRTLGVPLRRVGVAVRDV